MKLLDEVVACGEEDQEGYHCDDKKSRADVAAADVWADGAGAMGPDLAATVVLAHGGLDPFGAAVRVR